MAAKKLKKASSKPVSKSAFVRGLSTSMPAKEVVAKARSAGLKISDRYVHVIRSIAKRAAKQGNGAATSARRGGRPISSKRTFVLSLPASMAASEVIDRAKVQGMTLTTNYVYKIRSAVRLRAYGPPMGRRSSSPGNPGGRRGRFGHKGTGRAVRRAGVGCRTVGGDRAADQLRAGARFGRQLTPDVGPSVSWEQDTRRAIASLAVSPGIRCRTADETRQSVGGAFLRKVEKAARALQLGPSPA